MKVRDLIEALQQENPESDVKICTGAGNWAGHLTNEVGSVGFEHGKGAVVIDASMCGL